MRDDTKWGGASSRTSCSFGTGEVPAPAPLCELLKWGGASSHTPVNTASIAIVQQWGSSVSSSVSSNGSHILRPKALGMSSTTTEEEGGAPQGSAGNAEHLQKASSKCSDDNMRAHGHYHLVTDLGRCRLALDHRPRLPPLSSTTSGVDTNSALLSPTAAAMESMMRHSRKRSYASFTYRAKNHTQQTQESNLPGGEVGCDIGGVPGLVS